MERMKPQHCASLPAAAGCVSHPLSLPSPHLIFISGAASTALGRERSSLTLAPLPRLELGPCTGRGLPGSRGRAWRPHPGTQRPQGSSPREGWHVGRSGVGKQGAEPPRERRPFLPGLTSFCPLAPRFGSGGRESSSASACPLAPAFAAPPPLWAPPVSTGRCIYVEGFQL